MTMEYEPIDVSGKYNGSVPEIFVCVACGVLVANADTHNKFHENQKRVADDATWAEFGGRRLA